MKYKASRIKVFVYQYVKCLIMIILIFLWFDSYAYLRGKSDFLLIESFSLVIIWSTVIPLLVAFSRNDINITTDYVSGPTHAFGIFRFTQQITIRKEDMISFSDKSGDIVQRLCGEWIIKSIDKKTIIVTPMYYDKPIVDRINELIKR